MSSFSLCSACHSSSEVTLDLTTDRSIFLGYGLEISIDDLEVAAVSGCRLCTLLSDFLRVVRNLSPDFRTSYLWRVPTDLFLQASDIGTLLIALRGEASYVDHFELYTHRGQPPIPAIGLGEDVPESLTLALATQKIKYWMSVCKQHPACIFEDKRAPELPTRLLFLGKHQVRLEDTAGQRGFYATLSHCWGTSQVLTTTSENLPERKTGIRWSSLPKIFQDAILLTLSLGLQYLWIDSLCIVQGDNRDWTHESARMASIYSNSYLNIAATSSSGSNGTLFTGRWTTPVPYEEDLEELPKRPMRSYEIPYQDSFGLGNTVIKTRYSTRPAHENVKLLHNSEHMKRSDVFQKGPLLTRSWVFQERLLSPRTVHFHATEMIWECKDSFLCECGILGGAEHLLHDGKGIIGKCWLRNLETDLEYDTRLAVRWLDCVELYSRLRITECTDKLPALAGLASKFGSKLQSQYLAGLWECDLPRSLCWKVIGEERDGPDTNTRMTYGKRCTPYCAPTWSWASIDLSDTGITSSFEARTAFEHLLVKTFSFQVDDRFELVAAECTPYPESPFGQVTSGTLIIRAASLSMTLFIDQSEADFMIDLGGKIYSADIDLEPTYLNSHESQYPGNYFPKAHKQREMEVLLTVFGYTQGVRDLPEERGFALIITPVRGLQTKYERIGILEYDASEPALLNADICTIEIV
ncbi:HET domain containing protein [Hyaloscypha variabilis]